MTNFPNLGFGLGLRQPHYEEVLQLGAESIKLPSPYAKASGNTPTPKMRFRAACRPKPAGRRVVDWFEVLSENFMEAHPGHWEFLADLRAMYPLVLHGVGLSIAGVDALDEDYLTKLKKLAETVKPAFISDHLCWTGTHGINSHDLLPVPYTKEALAHVIERVRRVQDILGTKLVLENPSTYVEFAASEMPEWEFLAALAERADSGLLLDVNNVYVSAFNHRYSAKTYIDAIPAERIAYIHLAGHRNLGTHIVDTHDDRVAQEVWDLYRYTIARMGSKATMVEWDGKVPALEVLLTELGRARDVAETASLPEVKAS